MKHLLLCIPLLALLTQNSCKKNKDDPLNSGPKISVYGDYQFAAKVNGDDFIPTGALEAFIPAITMQIYTTAIPNVYNILIYAYRRNDKATLTLYIKDVKGAGTYPLDKFTLGYPTELYPPSHGMFDNYKSSSNNLWLTNTIDTGYVQITEYSKSIKAYFSFKARNTQDNSIIEITNGYFSYK